MNEIAVNGPKNLDSYQLNNFALYAIFRILFTCRCGIEASGKTHMRKGSSLKSRKFIKLVVGSLTGERLS